VVNIVSPSMILKFLTQHLDQLPQQLLNREISRIPGVVTPSVSTIRTSERALDAFAMMIQQGYSALGCEVRVILIFVFGVLCFVCLHGGVFHFIWRSLIVFQLCRMLILHPIAISFQ
jgi:hypothetical protein